MNGAVQKKCMKKRREKGNTSGRGERDRERDRERAGNDPCIERLGSPTSILAHMVHWLQSC